MAARSLVKVNSANFTEIAVWLTRFQVRNAAHYATAVRKMYFCPKDCNTEAASSASGTRRAAPVLREVSPVVVKPLPEA